jgi:hypothetical protein
VQSETIKLNKSDAEPLTISLWHSREAVACDRAGNPVQAIRLLVRAEGRELYRYDPGAANEEDFQEKNLWMGGRFNVQDVIGDGVPQVIFVSGLGSATDALFHLHIIRLDPPDHVIRDVAPPDFQYGELWGMEWLAAAGGRVYGVLAQPVDDVDSPCHMCAHRYAYKVYGWRKRTQAFVLLKTIAGSSQKFEGGNGALEAAHDLLARRLQGIQ